ncbi:TM1266 family iron-only hydrogenase system putative regulator [Agrilactobacillus yilanensis]|uniref:TM1266 family iron-only hydrogenase system putative regulator n=1 Tax=Agrilactobacillus yilanensis TaxID=2485997 RepID=A0ABW4J8R7_9LACO|nr:TM1266 family iron-only hydrogenase system putative regulator [Agrilactobacillus yilanensis]
MNLDVENGSFSYVSGTPVIKQLDFHAASGQLIAILGPNGAGKTTLLRCIMGLLKWDGGTSTLNGQEIAKMSSKKLWQQVSYVPQARGAFASLTVEDMILLGCTSRIGLFATPGEKERQLVADLVEELGIQRLLYKNCSEISGGELQMVLIARAMAAQPQLLILDEPESNLDFKNQLIVLDTMTKLANEGICCIFNTHYPNHALMRASQSLILQKGGDSIFGDTTEVVTESNIEEAFGVEAVIGEIETPGQIYQSVMPLRVTEKNGVCEKAKPSHITQIATISIIVSDPALSEKINALLHNYRDYIVGRMGLPYVQGGVSIINITLDAPIEKITALTHQIDILPDVNVKTTVAKKVVPVG